MLLNLSALLLHYCRNLSALSFAIYMQCKLSFSTYLHYYCIIVEIYLHYHLQYIWNVSYLFLLICIIIALSLHFICKFHCSISAIYLQCYCIIVTNYLQIELCFLECLRIYCRFHWDWNCWKCDLYILRGRQTVGRYFITGLVYNGSCSKSSLSDLI